MRDSGVIVILVVFVVLSAIAVIALNHHGRQLSTQLHALQRERDALDVEWGRLLLEEATWSEHRRVEGVARERLGMSMPTPDQVFLVDLRALAEP